jgi:tetratricopeptide (TPR) repeat protein
MFKKKYLLLELDAFDAEFFNLPNLVPYFEKDQKSLNKEGFDWIKTIKAMEFLIKDEDCEEYKPYKLFIKKWSLYEKLTKLTEEKQWVTAIETINQILEIDPNDPSAYLNLGLSYRSQQLYYQAEQAYLKGLELVSHQIPFLIGLARTYKELGKFEEEIYYWHLITEQKNGDKKEAETKLVSYDIYKFNNHNELVPSKNFLRLAYKIFQKSYNNNDALTRLGVKLVHFHLTTFAVKVFERVYQLSKIRPENNPGL